MSIVYSHQNFLVYDKESSLELRRTRIVGRLVGCSPSVPHQLVESGFPYLLNPYAASLAQDKDLAKFLKLTISEEQDDNGNKFQKHLEKLEAEAEEEYKANRLKELVARNLEPTPNRMGRFNKNKLRIEVQSMPCNEQLSVCQPATELEARDDKYLVFNDLHRRGFFVTLGTKFGCDFLCYPGDPIRYHALYAVRLIEHPLERVDYNEINALNRLTRGAKKILLLAQASQAECSPIVKYWSLAEKQYLSANFQPASFQPTEPTASIHLEGVDEDDHFHEEAAHADKDHE